MKRFPLILFATVLTLSASAFFAWGYYQSRKNTQKFKSEEFGISFSYPSDWQVLPKERAREYNFDAQIGLVKTIADETSFGIEIREAPGKTNFKTKESLEVLEKSLPEKLDEYVKISGKEFKFLAVPAIELVYTFRPYSEGGSPRKSLKQRQIIFLKLEKLYFVTFTALDEDYSKDVKDFNRILKSLRVG